MNTFNVRGTKKEINQFLLVAKALGCERQRGSPWELHEDYTGLKVQADKVIWMWAECHLPKPEPVSTIEGVAMLMELVATTPVIGGHEIRLEGANIRVGCKVVTLQEVESMICANRAIERISERGGSDISLEIEGEQLFITTKQLEEVVVWYKENKDV